MPTAGSLIWSGLVPVFKLYLSECKNYSDVVHHHPIAAGFVLTKKGMFSPAASKGLGQITLNISLPCLIFASIVPSFSADNVSALGPLIMSAVLYELIGLVFSLIIREIFWVPRNFQWGILMAGTLSNWGNLPTAIVQSVATNAPFDPDTDPTLGVAYISVFMIVYNLSFFSGAYKVCAWDFLGDPNEPDVRISFKEKWRRRGQRFQAWRGTGRKSVELGSDPEKQKVAGPAAAAASIAGGGHRPASLREEDEAEEYAEEKKASKHSSMAVQSTLSPDSMVNQLEKHQAGTLRPRTGSFNRERADRLTRQISAVTVESILPMPLVGSSLQPDNREHQSPIPSHPNRSEMMDDKPESAQVAAAIAARNRSGFHRWFHAVGSVLATIVSPVVAALILALLFALVPPMKALLVDDVSGWSDGKVPNSPNGTPILAFVQDTATFVGGICIPASLMLLGASFARLKRPSSWSSLPVPAILSLMITKMVLLPVIGCFFIQGLSNKTTLFPKDQKVLSFVAMLLSGTPTALNQMVLTQLVAPEGGTDTLIAFLLPQYIFLFLASTVLTAVALNLIS
ncbi:Auxin efflux carrier [Phaffia rhodozyma]|uniref:Auxin efflux carrier n=1 Tax=Phaffia rhodozyma TaxID=264483 RepID=A0A0F7SSU5_PHARH|nr:Auxin efflux carrier [Phaffia rhodozyma]